jgi:hypothetical protein
MAASVQVSVAPQNSLIDLSGSADTMSIDLVGEYTGAGNLVGGAVNLSFDPSVLQVLSVTLLAPADISGLTGTIDNMAGTVDRIAFASFSGVAAGTFTLATLEIQGVGAGVSALDIADAQDIIFEWYNDAPPFGESVSFSGVSGSITVAAVPEAETWGMMLAGLGLIGWVMGRRQHA